MIVRMDKHWRKNNSIMKIHHYNNYKKLHMQHELYGHLLVNLTGHCGIFQKHTRKNGAQNREQAIYKSL